MNSQRCLRIADRIDVLLQERLGCGIDLQRMMAEPAYRRDVLLVCDAHRGEELAGLARQFRDAAAEMASGEPSPLPSEDSAPGGIASSQFDAARPSEAASSSLPPDDPAARAELQRRAHAWYSPARWRR